MNALALWLRQGAPLRGVLLQRQVDREPQGGDHRPPVLGGLVLEDAPPQLEIAAQTQHGLHGDVQVALGVTK